MLKSLKKKLSRRSSNPLTGKATEDNRMSTQGGYPAPGNSSSFTNPLPATRHPSHGSTNPFAQHSANDAPPAYTPNPANTVPVVSQAPITTSTDDDPYANLRRFDTIFLIDDSGSMAGSRWAQVEEALKIITPICAPRDKNGIDVYFLNNTGSQWENQKTASSIVEMFQVVKPGGFTLTGRRLEEIIAPRLLEYKENPGKAKPLNIIVITDGESQDDVAGVIKNVAGKLDEWEAPPWQVGIQFLQIGNDPKARSMLKQLDDELAGNSDLRDIVDTVPFTSETGGELTAAGIMKVVLGSVNRHLDRSSKELHR